MSDLFTWVSELKPRDWFSLASVATSIASLCISISVARSTKRRAIDDKRQAIDDAADALLTKLLDIQLIYPEYRSQECCDALLDLPENDPNRLRLEAYCTIAFNAVEFLTDTFGIQNFSPESPYFGPVQRLAVRHRKWLMSGKPKHYPEEMIRFLDEAGAQWTRTKR